MQTGTSDKVVVSIGNDERPFPIPLVKKDDLWRFDTEEGSEEILARRIGRNELDAIQVCLAFEDAQREYALKDRDADGLLQYAQIFRSDKRMKNGLYWDVKGPGKECTGRRLRLCGEGRNDRRLCSGSLSSQVRLFRHHDIYRESRRNGLPEGLGPEHGEGGSDNGTL